MKEQAAVLLPVAVNIGFALGIAAFETIFSYHFRICGGYLSTAVPEIRAAYIADVNHGFSGAFLSGSLVWTAVMVIVLITPKKRSQTQDG
jgi:hypothetical protein